MALLSDAAVRQRERFAGGLLCTVLAVQGFHEFEHIVQVVQRFALGIPNGSGVLGSVADIEPVHLIYNVAVLALLVEAYLLLGFHQEGSRRRGAAAFWLMTAALFWQSWHSVEHVAKIVEYLALGFQNGTGGVLGAGPGGLVPLFNIPWLHFWYNTVLYALILPAAFACRLPLLVSREVRSALSTRTA
ncbi:MAG: hypothetical protein HW416_957 [Chloroflexi bacterium]|nr:hypothetical protein [Chloroflexota bacterium]